MEKQETESIWPKLPAHERLRYNASAVTALFTLVVVGGLDRLLQRDVSKLLIADLLSFSAMAFIGMQFHGRFLTRGWKAAAVPIIGYSIIGSLLVNLIVHFL